MSSSRVQSSFTGTPASLRDPGRLDHVVVGEPPAEAAADPRHVDRDVGLGDAERARDELPARLRVLGGRPDLDLAVLEMRGAVLRLERGVRDERIEVGGLDDLGRALQRGLHVAVVAQRPGAAAARSKLGGAAREAFAALLGRRRLRPTSPRACWRACCAAHQLSATIATPPSRPVELAAALDHEGVPHAGQRLDSRRGSRTSTLPPNTGHFSKTAYSMPGTLTSMPKSGLPVTIAGLSTPAIGLPMIL